MTFEMAEGFVDALEAYLQTNMAAKLDALDTEYTDSIVLEDPVTSPSGRFAYVGAKNLQDIPSFPALYIVSPTSSAEPWEAYAGEQSIKSKPQAYVGVVVLDPDEESLQLRLYRYARAITELLLEALGTVDLDGWDIVGPMEIDTLAGGPVKTVADDEDATFYGEVSIGFRGQKTETQS